MTSDKIRARLEECATLFAFEIDGKEGHIDPCYSKENGFSYYLWFEGEEKTVYTLDDVMTVPFFKGQSLSEIADKITILEW